MDKISLPEFEVVDFDNIAPHITGLNILMVNAYAISSMDGTWTMIDAGLPMSGSHIVKWAQKRFGDDRPQSIVLTHGHFDHVGGLKDLLNRWDVPVYCHPAELPFLTGETKYAAPDATAGGGVFSLLAPLFPRGPHDFRPNIHALPADGSIPGLPAWKWVHTPGHAPGHISLFRDTDNVLVVGDAFCTTKQESFFAVATQRPELHGPPAYYTPDWAAARRSIEKLASLEPNAVAPGHGYPMVGPHVRDALKLLASEFDRVVLPDKYAKNAGYTHEDTPTDTL